jgi:hypothetical protein
MSFSLSFVGYILWPAMVVVVAAVLVRCWLSPQRLKSSGPDFPTLKAYVSSVLDIL